VKFGQFDYAPLRPCPLRYHCGCINPAGEAGSRHSNPHSSVTFSNTVSRYDLFFHPREFRLYVCNFILVAT
jgi:hypothetical protein